MRVRVLRAQDADPALVKVGREVFHDIDTDGDGRITLDEMEDYCLGAYDEIYDVMKDMPEYMKKRLYRKGGTLPEEVTAPPSSRHSGSMRR